MGTNATSSAENKQNLKALNERYTQRFTVVKQGQIALARSDVRTAIKQYNMYLKIMADVKGVPDANLLSPQLFDPAKELSEMLLISNVYWDLTKLFDMSPHLESEFQKSLSKFIEFTMGFKYQVVNAELLRAYLKKSKINHRAEFKEAYKKIYISSKKCYIATHSFGEDHQVTKILRSFKDDIAPFYWGQKFIDWYYFLSPPLVKFCENHHNLSNALNTFVFRPTLTLFSALYLGMKKLLRAIS